MRQQLIAVGDGGALETFAIQPEPANQRMDGYQSGPGHVIGVDLVTGHQQRGGPALGGVAGLGHQRIHSDQAVRRGVVRLAAGAMQQIVVARTDNECRTLEPIMDKVRRPLGDALLSAVALDQQVVFDQPIHRQRPRQREIDQVQPGRGANAQWATAFAVQGQRYRSLLFGLQGQAQLQWLAGHQPKHQPPRLEPAQHGPGKHKGKGCRGVGWCGAGHATARWTAMEHQSVTNGAGSPGFVGLSRSTESVDEKSVILPTHCSVMRLSLVGWIALHRSTGRWRIATERRNTRPKAQAPSSAPS